jgi:carbon monoxide dehydrogenase subunit G
MNDTTTGYLLMADISGYTSYLNESELEHARETLGSLLEVLVDRTRPPLVVSKLEGDAVLSYTPDTTLLNGQTLVEIIETTYVAFRQAIELMVLNNTCQCNACANVSALDLKLFLHHGTFALQKVGEREELFGNDVILTHRLLKNTIPADTGIRAYAAYTQSALARLGDEMQEEMAQVELNYDDIAPVTVWVQDLHPVWETRREQQIIDLDPKEIDVEFSFELSVSPEVVWDYLNDRGFSTTLLGADRVEVVDKHHGRTVEGSTVQCYHGDKVVSQVILEWRPFHRIVTRDRLPYFGGGLQVFSVTELEPTGSGTVVTIKIGGMTGPALFRIASRIALPAVRKDVAAGAEAFRSQVETDHASRVETLTQSG